jgi:hypothetical protein
MCCTTDVSLLDNISKISSIIIAAFTLFFTLYIFWFQNKKNSRKENIDRKIDALKTIILQNNLSSLFIFFDKVLLHTKVLNEKDLVDDDKKLLNDNLQDELRNVRLKFTDLLLAVDSDLYEKTKKLLDEMIDKITESMFDEGINLKHYPKFEEAITTVISQYKTDIVKELYHYSLTE